MDFDHLSLDAPKIVTPPPGPRSRELLQRQERRESNARTYPRGLPIAVARAKGATIEDVDGNVYFDCLAGAGALNVGHGHPDVLRAVHEQLDAAAHTLDLPSAVKDRFTEQIFSILPRGYNDRIKIQFSGPTGSDAVEGALKLVKSHTGRRTVLSFQGGYHGVTAGALALTGLRSPKERVSGLMPDVHFMPYPYCYHCPLSLEPSSCQTACMSFVESVLADPCSGVTVPAGIIFEAIQGEGGTIPAPAETLRRLRHLATAYGVPLIADEVQSGVGRTGRWFGFEHAEILPDVIVMSKGAGGIGLPIAIIVYRDELDTWQPGAHIGTFRGHLPAMAAGVAAIDVIRRDGLLAHAADLGQFLMAGFREIQTAHALIGDVRGAGMMIGVEVIDASGSREAAGALGRTLQSECLRRGLIIETGGRFDSVLRFLPPLTLSRAQAQRILDIVGEAVAAVAQTAAPRRATVKEHAA